MQKWDYWEDIAVFDRKTGKNSWTDRRMTRPPLMNMIELGKQGWELAAIDKTIQENVILTHYYFKKPASG